MSTFNELILSQFFSCSKPGSTSLTLYFSVILCSIVWVKRWLFDLMILVELTVITVKSLFPKQFYKTMWTITLKTNLYKRISRHEQYRWWWKRTMFTVIRELIKMHIDVAYSSISTRIRIMVFNAIFNNISVISWRSVLLVEETGVPVENHQYVASHWQT